MMIEQCYEKDVVIIGIGQFEVVCLFSKLVMCLIFDVCLEVIVDVGLECYDIDGVVCWLGDNNNGDFFFLVGFSVLKSVLGLNFNWFGVGYEGFGLLVGMINGVMVIVVGLCWYVLVFCIIIEVLVCLYNKQVGVLSNKIQGCDSSYVWQWFIFFNVLFGINLMVLYVQCYFYEYGIWFEQFVQIVLIC